MSDDPVPLITAETKIKVSSTLDKSVGKKYLIDGNPETCWTSQQGTPQYIQLSFPSPVVPARLSITFQGGFVGTRCAIEVTHSQGTEKAAWQTMSRIYPEDVNRKQSFDVSLTDPGTGIGSLKLIFEESSDFFGRITVYDIQLEGKIGE
ncbi:galactose-binding like protein [Wolfiporia cocos MD-104 SS10]|uniref:Galactose-binding like protein n=1 Tax=Wolfiporia cocos (strain MD-104) TaxID=742152 RepID=A0A2H3JE52_WOLCO|nr:galactose-binding like protein [Wolfiporia cocos MD-104 SS10]